MDMTRPIPQYSDSLSDFVQDLRVALFETQGAVAKHFHVSRTTITRYESGSLSAPTAPVGYIAELAKLFFTAQDDEEVQNTLLKEVNKAIKVTYNLGLPFRNWDALVASADAYLRNLRQKKNGKTLDTSTEQQHQELWSNSPDIAGFYGRSTEVDLLCSWILDKNCRVVTILGMGGIGKTMLAKKVATEVTEQFDYIVWRSLSDELPPEELLHDCLDFLTASPRDQRSASFNGLCDQLLAYLSQHRCLLIIDNFETVLIEGEAVGRYRAGFERYSTLLSTLGRTEHKSCLLITSRENPREVRNVAGEDALVQSLQLGSIEVDTAKQILIEKHVLFGTDKNWRTLIHALSGNPFALEMTANVIQTFSAGNIDRAIC